MCTVKEQVCEIAEALPEDATWEQVRYALHVREQIELGEAAISEGRTIPHEQVKKRFAVLGICPGARKHHEGLSL